MNQTPLLPGVLPEGESPLRAWQVIENPPSHGQGQEFQLYVSAPSIEAVVAFAHEFGYFDTSNGVTARHIPELDSRAALRDGVVEIPLRECYEAGVTLACIYCGDDMSLTVGGPVVWVQDDDWNGIGPCCKDCDPGPEWHDSE